VQRRIVGFVENVEGEEDSRLCLWTGRLADTARVAVH
jgi:hypothetical protein